MTERVAVGFDGSDGSWRALRWAVGEARARGVRLQVVTVWSYMSQPSDTFDPDYGEDDALALIDQALQELGDELDGVEVERSAICDLPVQGLLGAAEGADLMVVGSRGLGGFQGLLLGSVSLQLAQHCPCPIVIVPGDERDAGGEGA